MEYYNGKLRLGGSLRNEVPKAGMSAAEVVLLRAIHGNDAVVDLVKIGERQVSHRAERDRLKRIYGGARDKQEQRIIDLALPAHAALPEVVFDGVQLDEEIDEEDEAPLEAPAVDVVAAQATKRQRAPKPVDLTGLAG